MVTEIVDLPSLAPRASDSNKGSFGRVLIIAGSRGMSGAAVLCGSAALRGGAGLVRVAVPEGILAEVAVGNPCYTTTALPQDDAGRLASAADREVHVLVEGQDVIAMGPGLGRSADVSALVASVVRKASKPLVLDADGLNAMAEHPGGFAAHAGPIIITPHPGEFARLLRTDTKTVQAQRRELAMKFAADNHLAVLLKGHGTIVTDGQRVYQNATGNPGMATAGSGDVLTGVIAALLGQGLEPFAAAQLGVFVHGRAGDLARDALGEISLVATDILDFLAHAFRSL